MYAAGTFESIDKRFLGQVETVPDWDIPDNLAILLLSYLWEKQSFI